MKAILSIAILTGACALPVCAADNMQAFPPAEKGMTRHVINLAKLENEGDFKVELIVGKTVRTDAVNRYFFGGTLETQSIPGWGFDRYVLQRLGPMAGTLMAVDPKSPQVERFVSLGEGPLVRYNSQLPLVVYVPEGVEVRHRIWHAEPADSRFVQKLALPTGQTAIISEGDLEARSTGSYSVRVYSTPRAKPGDDTTFFASGVVRPRDGAVETVYLAQLDEVSPPSLIVAIRSPGSGGYLSADAFTVAKDTVAFRASVAGLPAEADPVAALKASAHEVSGK